MGMPFFPAARLSPFPFRLANLAAFFEDLLHEIISGKGPARPTPILGTLCPRMIGKQGAHLSLQGCHSFFKPHSSHDCIPYIEINRQLSHYYNCRHMTQETSLNGGGVLSTCLRLTAVVGFGDNRVISESVAEWQSRWRLDVTNELAGH